MMFLQQTKFDIKFLQSDSDEMEIQEKKNQSMSDSQDSWDPQQPQQQNINDKKPSLFQKITVKFDDRTIEKNLDAQCQNPILNSNLFPQQDQDENQEINFQENTDENQNKKQKMGLSQKVTMQMQSERKDKKLNKIDSTANQQALFDVVEDQQNESWMRKKVKTSVEKIGNKKQQRPLTCPQCFTQVCYVYELIKQNQRLQYSQQQESENKNQKKYKTKSVDNIVVHQHKVIRNRFCTQKMQKRSNGTSQNLGKLFPQDLQFFENQLKTRYEDINVKILISCQCCGLELGYWDVNQQVYILFNVI